MAKQSLAIKYRPKTFDDVTEQESTKIILEQQLESGEVKHAYLFCGGAGTGKTTCARIFANEINKGEGNPIELDAASNNSIEDVRDISQQAKIKALDSEYKIFIIDECHALSNSAWQAMLKLIEEPPAKAIFIFCTTDPQKIPATIISRVQRYDFQRISQDGIVDRLGYIIEQEMNESKMVVHDGALEYIAKIADGGMRDAITLLDKCLGYSTELTLENVVDALGTVDYSVMISLTDSILDNAMEEAITMIETVYASGKDIKQFVKLYTHFLLDVSKYLLHCEWQYINIPRLEEYEKWLDTLEGVYSGDILDLLDVMVRLDSNIKYSATPKQDIEAELILFMTAGGEE